MTPPDTSSNPVGYRLAEMTWPEVELARQEARLAIVPTGACEQHGPHMTLETDTKRAVKFSDLLAERLGQQAVVAPCLNVGVSAHHMAFPGTLTLSPVTFQQVLYEVVESLYKHGWRTFFILNGHGGNSSAIGVAVSRLQADFPDLRIAWSGITALVPDLIKPHVVGPKAAHSSEIETSQALYLAPELVRHEAMTADPGTRYGGAPNVVGVHAPRPFDQVSSDGATGTPSAATREIGEELVNAALDRLTDFLKQFMDLESTPATPGAVKL